MTENGHCSLRNAFMLSIQFTVENFAEVEQRKTDFASRNFRFDSGPTKTTVDTYSQFLRISIKLRLLRVRR
jgi:hypothetical protein